MKKIIGSISILFLSLFALQPLLSSGYFPMHDDTQVARVVVMGNALKEGQFPVRWVSDLGYGYGYPIFNFYGPLPYYVGGSLYALGIDSVVATKIMFGIGMIIAPLTLFFLVELFFGFFAGITASMLFLYAPYHAVEVYIRGSVGEYWAIAFVPLLLYGIMLSFHKKQSIKGIVIGSLSLSAIVVSHTILGFLTCSLLGCGLLLYFCVLVLKKTFHISLLLRTTVLVLLGLGLSAFFWLPAIMELSATAVTAMVTNASTSFFDHFVCMNQLWNSPWGYGGSASGCIDGMSFKFGKWQVIVFGISLFSWLMFRSKSVSKRIRSFFLFSVIGLIICTILMFQMSSPIWKLLPITSFIQYPWRLLTFGMMFIAICGAYIVAIPRRPIVKIILMISIITMTIFVNAKIFTPQYVYTRDSYAFETIEELRFFKSKISDEYLQQEIVRPQSVSDIVKSTIQSTPTISVYTLKETDTSVFAEIDAVQADQALVLHKAWFPGWVITANNVKVVPQIVHGLPVVNIPRGVSIIRMQFTNTPVRMLGNILSIVAIICIGFLCFYEKKTNT